jgi:hypothetical protein
LHRIPQLLIRVCGLALFIGVAGCDGPLEGDTAPAPVAGEDHPLSDSEYSINVYEVNEGSEPQLVKVGAWFAPPSDQPQPEVAGSEAIAAVVQKLEVQDCQNPNPCGAASTVSAEFLLEEAFQECVEWDRIPSAARRYGTQTLTYKAPGSSGTWYIFDTEAAAAINDSCDQNIIGQEVLLCMADKLTEVADAVDNVTWTAGSAGHKIVIPPQSTEDKFIVRDLALNVLGHLVRLDSEAGDPGSASFPHTAGVYDDCTDALLARANGDNNQHLLGIFSGAYLENLLGNETTVTFQAAAMNRLEYKAELLRAAGRLAKELIDESIGADIAGAERKRATATDPVLGAQAMWGQTEGSSYNSLEHALKMVFGRIEIQEGDTGLAAGIGVIDPVCGGHTSWDILDTLGGGFSARWNDQPPKTSGQSLAIATVQQSQIVLPSVQLTNISAIDLRDVLHDTLSKQQAAARGVAWNPAFESSPIGQSIKTVVDSLEDSDIRFGFERAFDRYRLATDEGKTIPELSATAGVTITTLGVDPRILTRGGGLVAQLAESDLGGDMMARLGKSQVNSACSDFTTAGAWKATSATRVIFQSPFHLADAIQTRLGRLSAKAKVSSGPGAADLAQNAEIAHAEMGSWASQGVVVYSRGNMRNSGNPYVEDDAGVDANVACPSEALLGHKGYCSEECPCDQGEGDCTSDNQCSGNLVCLENAGNWYGMPFNTGVCVPDACFQSARSGGTTFGPMHDDFCTACGCAAGMGDCDDDTECLGDLICVENNSGSPHFESYSLGSLFGAGQSGTTYSYSHGSSATDICLPADWPRDQCHASRTSRPPRYNAGYCSADCPCLFGEGPAAKQSVDCAVVDAYDFPLVGGLPYGGPFSVTVCGTLDLPESNTHSITVSGLRPEEIGGETTDDMIAALSIVYGRPWQADCVAGNRETCGNISPSNVIDLTPANTRVLTAGIGGRPGPTLHVSFEHNGPYGAASTPNHFFLVARQGPNVLRAPGRVLAVLHPPAGSTFGGVGTPPGGATAILGSVVGVISSHQRYLANLVFGTGDPTMSRGRTCTDTRSFSTPQSYCISGIERDMFVPLANELTSESETQEDSWKHYLANAEQAAAQADELGRQMIEQGKEREMRRESAQEELGQICGTFTDIASVSVNDGWVGPSAQDEALNQCLNPDTYDLVFLTVDPYRDELGNEIPTAQADIRADFCTPTEQVPADRLPEFCGTEESIDHQGLNFEQYVPSGGDLNCDNMLAAAATQSPEALVVEAQRSPWVSVGSLLGGISTLRYRIGRTVGTQIQLVDTGSSPQSLYWSVMQDDKPVMGPSTLFSPNPPANTVTATPIDDVAYIYPACEALNAADIPVSHCDGQPCTVSCLGIANKLRIVFGAGKDRSDELRRNVEAAIWNVGALAGSIPSGVFTVPVPAFNLLDAPNPNRRVQAPAIYGQAQYTGPLTGDKYILEIDETGADPDKAASESAELGQLWAPEQQYWDLRAAEDNPAWRGSIYSSAQAPGTNQYLVTMATSGTILFDETVVTPQEQTVRRETNLTQWLVDFQPYAADCQAPAHNIQGLYAFMDTTPPATGDIFYDSIPTRGSHARNICKNMKYPVFFEDLNTEVLYPRERLVKDIGSVPMSEQISDFGGENNTAPGTFTQPIHTGWPCHRWENDLANFIETCIPINVNCTERDGDNIYMRCSASRRFRPSSCSKGDRVELFINRYPDNNCQVRAGLAQGMALSCLTNRPPQLKATEGPPVIEDISDLRIYEAWLDRTEQLIGDALNIAALKDLPKESVDRFVNGTVFDSLGGGEQGKAKIEVSNGIESLYANSLILAGAFRELKAAVATIRLELEGVDLQQRAQELSFKRDQLELSRQMAVAAVQAVGGALKVLSFVSTDPIGNLIGAGEQIATAAANAYFAREQEQVLAKQESNAAEQSQNQSAQVLDSFTNQNARAFEQLQQALIAIRKTANDIATAKTTMQNQVSEGQWEMAKAMGADFAEINGQQVALHVNTVLNRSYNITRLRYGRALDQAKRAAYIARLAIEQRLGVRLSTIDEPLGPLAEPVSVWIDDVCSLQGIDYEALRVADSETPTFDDLNSETIQNFSNQYIGDYVARLREFVEFYNIEYPFRQADDVAVLSLREHLLKPEAQCIGQSRNELYYSDALNQTGDIADDGASYRGWRAHGCEGGLCLQRYGARALVNNATTGEVVAPPGGYGGVTWLLLSEPAPTTVIDPEEPLSPPVPTGDRSPVGSVYQTVPLLAGRTYVLSWWDMARDLNGAPFSGTSTDFYTVAVYDAAWDLITLATPRATSSGAAGTTWSDRHTLEFTAFNEGDYHVVFTPSEDVDEPASLAIANVQVEEPAKDLAANSAYTRTEGSRTVANTVCDEMDAEQLRQAFKRRCEGGRGTDQARQCFYELERQFLIDTELINAGFSGPVGQIGQGNYNDRIVDVSLNVVGTGVLDCTNNPTAGCYSSAFLEYDLEHRADNVPVIGYDNEARCFDFARGAVRGGKALAAERYITLPFSSADEGLLAQPAFRKTELFGRPVSGVYRLRIRENPALVFDNLEDIQMILRYRYWSRVQRPEGE